MYVNNREVENKAEKNHSHPKQVTFIVNKVKIINCYNIPHSLYALLVAFVVQ